MSQFDVFNGDADGICALHQLRLAQPREGTLVTGVKRDIGLLARVAARAGDSVTVLDISLDRNRQALLGLLEQGVQVEYFDHHYAGLIPPHPGLTAHIDPRPQVCTSALVDAHLAGRFRRWAVVAAFGDNLHATARALARSCGVQPQQLERLRELGEAINYNAYGETESDLLLPPAALYRALLPYADPLDFMAGEPVARQLGERRAQDLALAREVEPEARLPAGCIYRLPDAGWSRRVAGSFANELAQRWPQHAHAVCCPASRGGYTVSVRAPLAAPEGADTLCRAFAGGGGRAAAAGIDALPAQQMEAFVRAFAAAFPAAPREPRRSEPR